jgi:hypothetical protein
MQRSHLTKGPRPPGDVALLLLLAALVLLSPLAAASSRRHRTFCCRQRSHDCRCDMALRLAGSWVGRYLFLLVRSLSHESEWVFVVTIELCNSDRAIELKALPSQPYFFGGKGSYLTFGKCDKSPELPHTRGTWRARPGKPLRVPSRLSTLAHPCPILGTISSAISPYCFAPSQSPPAANVPLGDTPSCNQRPVLSTDGHTAGRLAGRRATHSIRPWCRNQALWNAGASAFRLLHKCLLRPTTNA